MLRLFRTASAGVWLQVLPLFMDGARSRAVGVLEVVQTVREMAVAAVIATIAGFLQVAPQPPNPWSRARDSNSFTMGHLLPSSPASQASRTSMVWILVACPE